MKTDTAVVLTGKMSDRECVHCGALLVEESITIPSWPDGDQLCLYTRTLPCKCEQKIEQSNLDRRR